MKTPTLRAIALAAAFACGCATTSPVADGTDSAEAGSGGSPWHRPTTVAAGPSSGEGGSSGAVHPATGATSGSGGAEPETTSAGVTTAAGVTVGAGVTAGATSGSGGGDTCAGSAPPADPKCYWEPVCPTASLDDLEQSYSPGKWLAVSLAMMARRYPSAQCLIDMYSNDVGNYADTGSLGALAESMMTMVHEETHGFDYDHANWGSSFAYYVGCNHSLTAPWVEGFERSEILAQVEGNGTSLYDGTYLTGQQGTYSWLELLDEWNAYLNGMAAIGLVGDKVAGGISGTDGAVAFAYYVELYLRVARTQHPSVYAAIAGDPAFVSLLRTQWNRMHFFLALADKYGQLSIKADEIKAELYAPKNQGELEMVLGGPITASACN